jgi:cytochrome c oxidase cbb3-type subunit IV
MTMDLDSVIGSVSTVVAVLTFGGIVAWAYAERRRDAFAMAADAPFALPDETGAAASTEQKP